MLVIIPVRRVLAQDDPRLQKPDVAACVENAKLHLRSEDYFGENETKLIGACRDVDPECVSEIADSLHPSRYDAKKFLLLVRGCRGRGTGDCFRALKDKTKSFDRSEYDQVLALLKKCD